jgi:hypothetical protein
MADLEYQLDRRTMGLSYTVLMIGVAAAIYMLLF